MLTQSQVRKRLGLEKGALDVLVGGPPCQGFSINAPERFLSDNVTSCSRTICGFSKSLNRRLFFSRTFRVCCPRRRQGLPSDRA